MPGGLIISVDANHPQPRHVDRAVAVLEAGGLIALPTDTYYGLCTDVTNRKGIEKLYQLKGMPRTHALSLICADISEIAQYARVDDAAHRFLRKRIPGAFTFILPATKHVPDMLMSRHKTIGVRVPDSPIALAVVQGLGRPLITTSAATPDGEVLIDPRDIRDFLGHGLELVLDGGYQLNEPSSVIDLTGEQPVVIREGKGDVSDL